MIIVFISVYRFVMLQDIPDFEIFATHFRSIDYSTNIINVSYETQQSNYNQSLHSPFGSFLVSFFLFE